MNMKLETDPHGYMEILWICLNIKCSPVPLHLNNTCPVTNNLSGVPEADIVRTDMNSWVYIQ